MKRMLIMLVVLVVLMTVPAMSFAQAPPSFIASGPLMTHGGKTIIGVQAGATTSLYTTRGEDGQVSFQNYGRATFFVSTHDSSDFQGITVFDIWEVPLSGLFTVAAGFGGNYKMQVGENILEPSVLLEFAIRPVKSVRVTFGAQYYSIKGGDRAYPYLALGFFLSKKT